MDGIVRVVGVVAKREVAVAVLRQIFGIVEFSIPIDAHVLDCHSPNSVLEAAGIAISS